MTHDVIVKKLVEFLIKNNHKNIACDLPNYHKPPQVTWKETKEGHIPDVTSTLSNNNYLFEVETEETLSTEHTISQLKLFSAHAIEKNKIFTVVVPEGCGDEMKKILDHNSIITDVLVIV